MTQPPVKGQVYEAISGWSHSFKDGEKIVYTGDETPWGTYLFRSLDPNTEAESMVGVGIQALTEKYYKPID